VSASDNPTPFLLPCPEQQSRYDMAAEDLADARDLDLGTVSRPQLLLAFERVRSALDEALQLIRDITQEDRPTERP
jgi:hypothetical protein